MKAVRSFCTSCNFDIVLPKIWILFLAVQDGEYAAANAASATSTPAVAEVRDGDISCGGPSILLLACFL